MNTTCKNENSRKRNHDGGFPNNSATESDQTGHTSSVHLEMSLNDQSENIGIKKRCIMFPNISAQKKNHFKMHSMKVDQICLSMPDQSPTVDMSPSPLQFLKDFLYQQKGIEPIVIPTKSANNFFIEPTEKQFEAYGKDVVQAVRSEDIGTLRSMHNSGRSLQCCNRFGESIIHMACRRGFTDMVSFLVKEADVSLRVRDDMGRTPMHDAFWTQDPNFEMLEILIWKDPDLLLMSDNRGHTPFDYARRDHWGAWLNFLSERESLISSIGRDIAQLKASAA